MDIMHKQLEELTNKIDQLCEEGQFSEELLTLMEQRDQLELDLLQEPNQEDVCHELTEEDKEDIYQMMRGHYRIQLTHTMDSEINMRVIRDYLTNEGLTEEDTDVLLRRYLQEIEDEYQPYMVPMNMTLEDILTNRNWIWQSVVKLSLHPITFPEPIQLQMEDTHSFLSECSFWGLRFRV